MLSKKDKAEIRAIIQDELKAALVREITVEKGPRKQGDPEKTVEKETMNVLDFLAIYLPQIEGALRGVQADVDTAKNKVEKQHTQLAAVGAALIGMEGAVKEIAILADKAIELEGGKPKLVLISEGPS